MPYNATGDINKKVQISSDQFIFRNKAFKRIKEMFNMHALHFKNEILAMNNAIQLTQGWIARSRPGAEHHKHFHPNTFFSCAFYARCAPSEIKFSGPRPYVSKQFSFSYSWSKFTDFNAQEYRVPIHTGCLLMFPGRLFHQTSPNKDKEDKVTLGANYFLKGEIGKYEDTDLIIL
tara:strand:+ start:547 stop:1071 length:525 start_codon:yes stop_codon:yes gene_type:complete